MGQKMDNSKSYNVREEDRLVDDKEIIDLFCERDEKAIKEVEI